MFKIETEEETSLAETFRMFSTAKDAINIICAIAGTVSWSV